MKDMLCCEVIFFICLMVKNNKRKNKIKKLCILHKLSIGHGKARVGLLDFSQAVKADGAGSACIALHLVQCILDAFFGAITVFYCPENIIQWILAL